MSDLIDRQAAIDYIRVQRWRRFDGMTIEQAVITMIEEVPTIEERKTGKWIHDGYDFSHGNDWIHCSECGKRGINVPADLTNFCSNCGADMRGEGHE